MCWQIPLYVVYYKYKDKERASNRNGENMNKCNKFNLEKGKSYTMALNVCGDRRIFENVIVDEIRDMDIWLKFDDQFYPFKFKMYDILEVE